MATQYEKIESITITITTGNTKKSATDDSVMLQIGGHKWQIDKPNYDDFEKGKTDSYDLEIPEGMDSSWFRFLCFQKKNLTGKSDDWEMEKVVLMVNGNIVYEKAGLKAWLTFDKPRYCAPGFNYGKAGE